MTTRHHTILLLGPTGSGKTPLGRRFESCAPAEHRCLHFDFGENLRQTVARATPDDTVTADDIDFLRQVLKTGALLEDQDFPLAERILLSFLARRQADETTLLVLNGLPRHVGQAARLPSWLSVRLVLLLNCTAEVVFQRIASNAGGDRAHRTDDQIEAVKRKLEQYRRRTMPLVDHYRARGARIVTVDVTATMTAAEMWRAVEPATPWK